MAEIVEPVRSLVHRATDWMRACWRPSPVGMHPDQFQRWAQGRVQYREQGMRTRGARINVASMLMINVAELQRGCAMTDERVVLERGLGDVLMLCAILACEMGVDLDEVMRKRVAEG